MRACRRLTARRAGCHLSTSIGACHRVLIRPCALLSTILAKAGPWQQGWRCYPRHGSMAGHNGPAAGDGSFRGFGSEIELGSMGSGAWGSTGILEGQEQRKQGRCATGGIPEAADVQ